MKNLIIFCVFIMIMVMAQFAQGQTVDEVLEKNIAAMGGKEKLATLNSVRMEGTLIVQGTDVSIISTRVHTVGSRTDISVMGTENYQIVTPAGGLVFMPVMGQANPENMPDDQFKASQTLYDLHGVFVNYKEKGTKLELMGKETIDGTECYKLKATFKNSNVTDYYVDTKTSRLYKTSTKASVNGTEMDMFTIYTNYKQDANGYWIAYTTTNNRGETNFDKVETNVKVDETLFKIK
jgi:hypothetical protein